MNEQERRSNRILYALDAAHRLGRLTREEYRARRRALLISLGDSDGVTARQAIVPHSATSAPGVQSTGNAVESAVDEASMLFPERRVSLHTLWRVVGGMVLVAMLLVYWMLRPSTP